MLLTCTLRWVWWWFELFWTWVWLWLWLWLIQIALHQKKPFFFKKQRFLTLGQRTYGRSVLSSDWNLSLSSVSPSPSPTCTSSPMPLHHSSSLVCLNNRSIFVRCLWRDLSFRAILLCSVVGRVDKREGTDAETAAASGCVRPAGCRVARCSLPLCVGVCVVVSGVCIQWPERAGTGGGFEKGVRCEPRVCVCVCMCVRLQVCVCMCVVVNCPPM